MAKETAANHTPESLKHLASELERWAADLRAGVAMLEELQPPISSINVRFESSRVVGYEYVRSWVNAVRQTASEARLAVFTGASPEKLGVQQNDDPPKRIRKSGTSPK